MPKILKVSAYSDILKVLSALGIKEQEVWGLSTIILPTFSIGQSAVFERIEVVINYGMSMLHNTWYNPTKATYWSSLQIVNYQNANLPISVRLDDDSDRSLILLPYEAFAFSNCRLKGVKQTSGDTVTTVRIIGGY